MDNLFSTHPNVENRIAALQEMARSGTFARDADGAAARREGPPPAQPDRGPWRESSTPAAGPWGTPVSTETEAEPPSPSPGPWGRNPRGSNDRWS